MFIVKGGIIQASFNPENPVYVPCQESTLGRSRLELPFSGDAVVMYVGQV